MEASAKSSAIAMSTQYYPNFVKKNGQYCYTLGTWGNPAYYFNAEYEFNRYVINQEKYYDYSTGAIAEGKTWSNIEDFANFMWASTTEMGAYCYKQDLGKGENNGKAWIVVGSYPYMWNEPSAEERKANLKQ